ncbi:hypothetical protein BT63DRAFT_443594 [Microthyrium microscopicum]|uniref:Integral membrane protein n=1 Tax=Microthyrium microscopicum TaxID=703497 RepID=A0A6A6TZB7_9PEZI|nr:hypothetical protein BT63DRAFT_443594 [Microthyrium microscopicum]
MDSPAPTFRKPDYNGETGVAVFVPVVASDESIITHVKQDVDQSISETNDRNPKQNEATQSQKPTSTPDLHNEEKNRQVTTESDTPLEEHHLTFSDTAKHAAEKVSQKLQLHREHARGPSEARQRRQSHAVIPNDEVHLPLYIHLRNAVYGSLVMYTTFPYWDMAFWSGWSYTWGSILFIIDGFWAWTPLQWPNSEFKGESEYGVGLLFFFGALFYQLGATMAYLEAINDGSFAGRAMKRHLEGHDEDAKRLLDEKLHMFFGHMIPHHHDDKEDEEDMEKQQSVDPEAGWNTRDRKERPGSIYPTNKAPAPRRGGVDVGAAEQTEFHEYLTWRWWPTWHALKTYHIREMGYIACVIQLFGATLYGICGVISLPGILSNFQPWQELGGYWIPQIVASLCFLTAGIMFTVITQDSWYRPLPRRIAWWIGIWATIGAVGFILSASFGVRSGDSTGAAYQSSLSSTWGSVAYLISSWLQWCESVNNGPVLAFPNNRIPTIMR